MALIFLLSAQSDLSTGLGSWDLLLRKLAHAGVFGMLTLLWLRALGPHTNRALLGAVTISLLFAISDEYHQILVSGRNGSPLDVNGSPLDVGVDAIGIGVAAVVARSKRFDRAFPAWRR